MLIYVFLMQGHMHYLSVKFPPNKLTLSSELFVSMEKHNQRFNFTGKISHYIKHSITTEMWHTKYTIIFAAI